MVYTWWIPRQNSGLHFDLPHSRQWARVLIFQIILGAGIRPNFQALTVAFQSAVKSSDVGSATSTFSFVRDLATSIGLVVGESFGAFRRQQNSAYQKRYHWRYLSECLRVFDICLCKPVSPAVRYLGRIFRDTNVLKVLIKSAIYESSINSCNIMATVTKITDSEVLPNIFLIRKHVINIPAPCIICSTFFICNLLRPTLIQHNKSPTS